MKYYKGYICNADWQKIQIFYDRIDAKRKRLKHIGNNDSKYGALSAEIIYLDIFDCDEIDEEIKHQSKPEITVTFTINKARTEYYYEKYNVPKQFIKKSDVIKSPGQYHITWREIMGVVIPRK